MAKSSSDGTFAWNITGITTGFEKALKKTRTLWRQATKAFKKDFQSLTKLTNAVGKGLTAVGAVGTAALGLIVSGAVDAGTALSNMADKLGVNIEAAQGLGFAFRQAAIDVKTGFMGLQRQARRIAEAALGKGEAVDALKELGLSAVELNRLAPEEQFKVIADELSKVSQNSDRVRLAFKLWDSEGVELLNVIKDGSKGIEEAEARAVRLGIVVSGEVLRRARAFGDGLGVIQDQLAGIRMRIADVVIRGFMPFMDLVHEAIGAIARWIDENPELVSWIIRVASAVALLSAVLGPLLLLLPTIVSSLGIIGGAIGAMISPLGLLAAVVGGALYVAFLNWEAVLRRIFGDQAGGGLAARIRELFGDELTLQQKVQLLAEIFRVMFEKILAGFEAVKARAVQFWNSLVEIFGPAISGFLETVRTGDWEPFVQGVLATGINAVNVLKRHILQAIREVKLEANPLRGLFGNVGFGLNPFAGQSRKLLGMAAGGLGDLFDFQAMGTSFARGGPTVVGERGPEVVNLPRGSQVIPNHALGGVTVEVNMQVGAGLIADRRSMRELSDEVSRSLARELEAKLTQKGFGHG